jgi:hypothetical protein
VHSTGQFHKGGPPAGRFLQLVAGDGPEVGDFRHLIESQALGDLQTLESHGLPVKRVRLDGDLAAGVREITKRVEGMR